MISTALQEEDVSIGGYTVHIYRTRLRKNFRTIVFVHGIGASTEYFFPLCEALSSKYNIVAFDLPGYGRSSKSSQTLTIEQLSRVVEKVIAQMVAQDCVVLGHSMGCQILAHMLRRNPRIIQQAIFIAPTVNRRERNIVAQSLRLLQDAFHEPSSVNRLLLKGYMHMGITRYFRTCRFMIKDSIESFIGEMAVPLLIVRGTHDHIVPTTWVTFLASKVEQVTIKEIIDGPHVVQYECVDQVASVCKNFLATHKRVQ